MKEKILNNLENPQKLELLYRENNIEFTESFNEIYSEISSLEIAKFWKLRLQADINNLISDETEQSRSGDSFSKRFDLLFTLAAVIICGTIIKIPQISGSNIQNFLTDNLPFIIFPAFTVYYLLKNNAESKKYFVIFSVIIISLLFMNIIPWQEGSHTRILSALHFSFITWLLLGLSYVNFDIRAGRSRMIFLKKNGDVFILTGVLMCAGMLLIMLSVAMFSVIDVRLDKVLEEYVVIYGLVSAPFAANYMIETSPKIINRVAPFISRLFTPLMLIVMTGFLIALVFFAKDPFNNREELIVFNIMLAVIIAVIIFSFSGSAGNYRSVYNKILLLLSFEAVIINTLALSAIIYRLFMFGVSPNRIAVLGANILLFANLIFITLKLIQFIRNKTTSDKVENSMTVMLPYYAVWAVMIAFIMPFLFGFK